MSLFLAPPILKDSWRNAAASRFFLWDIKANAHGTGTFPIMKRKGKVRLVKIMLQALSLMLKHEVRLCRYKWYFSHKPELNCSPDKTMFG